MGNTTDPNEPNTNIVNLFSAKPKPKPKNTPVPQPILEIEDNDEDFDLEEEEFTFTVTDTEIFAFIKVLRYIQSISTSSMVKVNLTEEVLQLKAFNEVAHDTISDELERSTFFCYSANIDMYLPEIDTYLEDPNDPDGIEIAAVIMENVKNGLAAIAIGASEDGDSIDFKDDRDE